MSLKSLISFFQENELIPFNTCYYPIIMALYSSPDRKGTGSKDSTGSYFFAIAKKRVSKKRLPNQGSYTHSLPT